MKNVNKRPKIAFFDTRVNTYIPVNIRKRIDREIGYTNTLSNFVREAINEYLDSGMRETTYVDLQKNTLITVWLPKETYDRLLRLSMDIGESMSSIILTAIINKLNKNKRFRQFQM